ncbi:hypothetical protein NHX12_010381 [Muraenolepis orangiensis]|uniref:Uncharacterized protein n=1 Tax=Muraenolepis orangiensis TaxID=630683 RepID=A0A9Q0DJM3_9TELE|nr:hypothetical protein NHX12_010381 [Muraenolepis orangiensis]
MGGDQRTKNGQRLEEDGHERVDEGQALTWTRAVQQQGASRVTMSHAILPFRSNQLQDEPKVEEKVANGTGLKASAGEETYEEAPPVSPPIHGQAVQTAREQPQMVLLGHLLPQCACGVKSYECSPAKKIKQLELTVEQHGSVETSTGNVGSLDKDRKDDGSDERWMGWGKD